MNSRLKSSRNQERATARLHGGRVQPGSGSRWDRKGDVRTKLTLIENKRTDATQITLKDRDLKKIWTEAWAEGRMPLIGFELGGRRYIVQLEDDYLEQEERRAAAGSPTVVEPG